MKKNKMMRIASVLLVAVLLSTCAISGTFAKYVTTGSGNDTARVAKWGVVITANGSMFAKHYIGHGNAGGDTASTEVTGSVDSSNGDNIIAPGTKGTMASMALSGSPEVAVSVTYEGTVTLDDNWKDSTGKYYCPIKVTVGSTNIYGLDYSSADAFKTAIEGAISGYSKTYNANTNLSTADSDSIAISWEWAFEAADGSEVDRTDEKDTYLGNQAAEGNAANITIAVTTTVTQID